jgi:hypothetical protein
MSFDVKRSPSEVRIMLNGRKNAVIGFGALFAFVPLELIAVATGVAAFLDVVLDIDLPFIPDSRDKFGSPGNAIRAVPVTRSRSSIYPNSL